MVDFMNSIDDISSYDAEFKILSEYFEIHSKQTFILKISKISDIKTCSDSIHEYINQTYKNYDMRIYICEDGKISDRIIDPQICSKSIELHNFALNESTNGCHILLKTKDEFCLFYEQNYVVEFSNSLIVDKLYKEIDDKLFSIDNLEDAILRYQTTRKAAEKTIFLSQDGKIKSELDERMLRNHLYSFLKLNVRGIPIHELCTSLYNDEESVDISIHDKNNRVVIIEVKYIVEEKFYSSAAGKVIYSYTRFRDGYRQLDKYCLHLETENNFNIHSSHLYMFFAHTCGYDMMMQKAGKYLEECRGDLSSSFNHAYRHTFLDDISNNENQRINCYQ